MEKKQFLDWLYYDVSKQTQNYEICYIWKDIERKSTKWRKYLDSIAPIDFDGSCDDKKKQWFFEKCNQRQILNNEVILDLENKEEYQIILNKLINNEEDPLYFRAYFTGSRGYHFSLFFNRNLSPEEKIHVIKHFNCDLQKNSNRTMIALEYAPHWKTGKNKELVYDNTYNGDDIGYNSLVVKNLGTKTVPHLITTIKPSNKKYNGN